MKKQWWLHIIACWLTTTSFAQHQFTCRAIHDSTGEPLPGLSVTLTGSSRGTVTDGNGLAVIRNISDGTHFFVISGTGFKEKTISIRFPAADSIFTFRMETDTRQLEEVIISSSRTDSRIENTPTRVEVLGSEEVQEESGIKPSHIASLLGDVAGIQTQQTSAPTGNTDIRIQGLPGSYTQLLRDGMPIFGGYSGSFSVLQLPPLDVKQIEIIKGASSTLYGGGAIGGLINIISKKPKTGVRERTLLLNQSTLRESNINLFLSDRDKKAGYTFFGGITFQQEVDVDKDGFSDVPSNENFFIHPVFFYYPNEKNTLSLGINSVFEDRRGGDMQVLMRYPNATHQFYIENQSFRNTFELNWDRKLNATGKFNVKADLSFYKRNITTNVFGMRARQLSYFTEASYVLKKGHHDWVAGINLNGERFRKLLPDSSSIDEYSFFTAGLFVQDDWHIHPKFTVEAGLRNDLHNVYGNFFLPRLALLYKINNYFNARVSGGMGYKVPTVFSNEVDERSYQNLRLDPGARAERSEGINADINFKKTFSGTQVIFNQSFYYTRISRPLVAFSPPGLVYFYTASQPVDTRGLETWIQVNAGKLETYFGYTLTDARKRYDASQPRVVLSARNKFATVIGYTITEKFTAIAEGSYTGHQYLDDGSKTPGYPLLACMLKFETGRCTFVLNGENLLNYRQSKKESILLLPTTNPGFRQLWAPIDGVVVNLSFKLRF